MTSLPAEFPVRDCANVRTAYSMCLQLESSLQRTGDRGENVGNNMIYIRILGYLMHHASTDQELKTVVETIITSSDNAAALLEFGQFYFDHYITTVRGIMGRSKTPYNSESPPRFDTLADMESHTTHEIPQDYASAKNKVILSSFLGIITHWSCDQALIRDHYRCVVTGAYDTDMCLKFGELSDVVSLDPSLRVAGTECAHIFSPSSDSSISEYAPTDKRHFSAPMWAMRRFGHEHLHEELDDHKIHRLENVMTLSPDVHELFHRLKLWFVPTAQKDTYRLGAVTPFLLRSLPGSVTFTTPDAVRYPVPDPDYLAIHASCAQVAHLSGAARCIDKFYEDLKHGTTLDPNGTSANMLEHAISQLQTVECKVIA